MLYGLDGCWILDVEETVKRGALRYSNGVLIKERENSQEEFSQAHTRGWRSKLARLLLEPKMEQGV